MFVSRACRAPPEDLGVRATRSRTLAPLTAPRPVPARSVFVQWDSPGAVADDHVSAGPTHSRGDSHLRYHALPQRNAIGRSQGHGLLPDT
jgi:hypothetical protein